MRAKPKVWTKAGCLMNIALGSLLGCALAQPVGAGTAEAADVAEAESELRGVTFGAMHAFQIEMWRAAGVKAATNLANEAFMSPRAADGWRELLEGDLSKDGVGVALPPALAEDFLAGAQTLMGPNNCEGAVFAWWNPFWDALLFVKTGGGELPDPVAGAASPASDAAKGKGGVSAASLLGVEGASPDTGAAAKVSARGRPPRIERFVWIDGASFRGGDAGLAGDGDSFSARLWRRQIATGRRFRELYPESDIPARNAEIAIRSEIENAPQGDVRQALRVTAFVRLNAIKACLKNLERKSKAFRGAEFLRKSSGDDLVQAFDSFETRPFCRRFAMLPDKARQGFALYGCFEGEGDEPDAMLVFVNEEMPRLYATGLFPKGILDKLDWPKYLIQFEWYDLKEAEKFLAVTIGVLDEKEVAQ